MNASPRSRPLARSIVALLPLGLSLALAACGRVPGQFEILNDQVPQTSGGCAIPVNPTVYQGEGMLDVSAVQESYGSAYFLFPLIENNLPGSNTGQDPNQIQLTGFDVDISTLGLPTATANQVMNTVDASFLHFRVPWSGGVSSGGGQISAAVEAVPVALAQALAKGAGLDASPSLTLNLRVQALGTTNSGRSMTSDPFNFPVKVCSGCLGNSLGPCPLKAAPTNTGNACNPAQDEVVDCCTDNGVLVCPAVWSSQ